MIKKVFLILPTLSFCFVFNLLYVIRTFVLVGSVVDGVWSPWSEWSECDVDCDYGLLHRNRTCDGVVGDGLSCEGPPEDTMECRILSCSRFTY